MLVDRRTDGGQTRGQTGVSVEVEDRLFEQFSNVHLTSGMKPKPSQNP